MRQKFKPKKSIIRQQVTVNVNVNIEEKRPRTALNKFVKKDEKKEQ